jgi:type II secretory ATPase GspE/PulE/Tfp pilus assembly ATPase PilB-like protein/chorismate-pyruvate lyase
VFSNFQWPLPSHFELPPGVESAGHEPALLHLARGQKLSGSLTRFLPSHGVIEFLPARGRANINIPIADILYLRLTRAVVLRSRATELEQRAPEMIKPSPRQPFRLELHGGEVLEGETMGFEVQSAGLFLYVAHYGDAVLRTFVPASAIKVQQIGKPLGEILVDEKLVTQAQVSGGLERQKELREQKLGDLLTEKRILSREELRAALERQRGAPMMKLGEALVAANIITAEQLAQALEQQKQNRKKPLGEILIEQKLITRRDLFSALSQKLGIPTIDVRNFRIDPAAIKRVPQTIAHECQVVPLCFDGQALVIAVTNPLDPAPIEKVRFFVQGPVTPVMASAEEIAAAIAANYGSALDEKRVEELATQLSAESAPEQIDAEPVKDTDNTLVQLVNKMIMDAHTAGASDIHVESNPGRANVRIRLRRDGVLSEYLQVAAQFRGAIISRLKIMANLDISERRRAQDGRINFQQFGPLKLELRIATIPTGDGLEDVVLRLLAAGEPLPLARLGLRAPLHESLSRVLERSYGLVLVCGPTGSGKTTTLHSLLGVLNAPAHKIWTAEDPVEISQTGLRQVQINARIGWTFAAAMRAFLRADPDIIMVGEMRDAETATIAVAASLTGHLVFSTLHTNSAPETVVRLLEMGLDPFSFADALVSVLAQRLARRLCPDCRTTHIATRDEIALLAQEYCEDTALQPEAMMAGWRQRFGEGIRMYDAVGCEACRGTGYRGRIGLHELLVTTPDLRQLMQRKAPASELRREAMRAGMATLRQDGIEKCLSGETDLREVRAVAS